MVRRVVITGMGVVSTFGTGVKKLWEAVSTARNGIKVITHFDTSQFSCNVGAPLSGFCAEDFLEKKYIPTLDIHQQIAYAASLEAVRDAGIEGSQEDPFNIGVVGGNSLGGLFSIEEETGRYHLKGRNRISPFAIPKTTVNMIPGLLAIFFRFRGPNIGISTSCATGNISLGVASRMIRGGGAEAVLVCCSEICVTPLAFAGFTRMRALAKKWEPDPTKSLRPFDRNRSGTLFGDGASALFLESLEHARKRNARIYAEIIGFASTDDGYHITAPDPEGEGAYQCMKRALVDARVSPEEVEYINAHGTGTPYNDEIETLAIKRLFGDYAYKIPVSASKSMIGHQLGAAGTTESIITIVAMNEGIIPPTLNLETPDPKCDLDYVPHIPRQKEVRIALTNSFGFGGHNACLIFKKMQDE